MKSKKPVVIFDTTLRDGEQAPGCHMNVAQKIEMAEQLYRVGVDVIEAGFPVSSSGDFMAIEQIAQTVGRRDNAPEICGLARCVPKDIDTVWRSVQRAKRPRIHVFMATSDIHLKHKFRKSRGEVLDQVARSVRYAKSLCEQVEYSAEDASRSDPGFLIDVLNAAIDSGATIVNIPDTVGFSMPSEFEALIRDVQAGLTHRDRVQVSVHCQDDLGLSVANTLAGIRAGADQAECTINGIGERAGNTSLEEVVMALHKRPDLFERTTRIRTEELGPASRMLARLIEQPVPPNKAIVGANAFAHASGVHQDGILKNPLTYEIMRPEEVGAVAMPLVLTSRSGRNALFHRLTQIGLVWSASETEAIYEAFKKLADERRIVDDEALRTLVRS